MPYALFKDGVWKVCATVTIIFVISFFIKLYSNAIMNNELMELKIEAVKLRIQLSKLQLGEMQ